MFYNYNLQRVYKCLFFTAENKNKNIFRTSKNKLNLKIKKKAY